VARRNEEDVRRIVNTSAGLVSAQEIYAMARERGGAIGLATVYRTLRTLVDQGDIDVTYDEQGQARYCGCGPSHHHHATCRLCGRTEEFENEVLEELATRAARELGFTDVRHVIELSGVCSQCASSR
jgi:Fur family ferric uptake transcriptional regulator